MELTNSHHGPQAPHSAGASAITNKIKVLFLSANPAKTKRLQIDKEIREIQAKIRSAEYRDAFEFIPRLAARPDDLVQALLEHKPEIVHFSGHGSDAQELLFLDEKGRAKPVSTEALVHVFRTLKDNIRLVLLNACSTRAQAEAIAGTIDCTIGMRAPIGDEAAIVFAASFYRALGFGRSVRDAFELGNAGLLLEGIPEAKTPVLMTRSGIDASFVTIVNPSPAVPAGTAVAEWGKSAGQSRISNRLELLKDLSRLAPSDWAIIVAAIPAQQATLAARAPWPSRSPS